MIYFALLNAELPRLPAEAPVLPERVCAQNRAALFNEAARDKARAIAKTAGLRRLMLANEKRSRCSSLILKRILRLGRLRLRGPNAEPKTGVPVSRHQPKISGNWPKLIPLPGAGLLPCEAKKRASLSLAAIYPGHNICFGRLKTGFFNIIHRNRSN